MSDQEFYTGYRRFCKQVDGYLSKAGLPSERVNFSQDRDKLQYSARIKSQGLTILGRPSGLSLTIRFGSGHQAVVPA